MTQAASKPVVVCLSALLGSAPIPPTTLPSTTANSSGTLLATYATDTGHVCEEANPIAELRRLSGLTFEQLAELFTVTRRTVHLWMSGQRRLPAKEEQVQRMLATLRRMDRGSAEENRAALLADGARAMDLLTAGDYELAVKVMGTGTVARRPTAGPISPEARAARQPPPPADLIDRTQDGPHPAIEKKRIKAWKITKGRGGT